MTEAALFAAQPEWLMTLRIWALELNKKKNGSAHAIPTYTKAGLAFNRPAFVRFQDRCLYNQF